MLRAKTGKTDYENNLVLPYNLKWGLFIMSLTLSQSLFIFAQHIVTNWLVLWDEWDDDPVLLSNCDLTFDLPLLHWHFHQWRETWRNCFRRPVRCRQDQSLLIPPLSVCEGDADSQLYPRWPEYEHSSTKIIRERWSNQRYSGSAPGAVSMWHASGGVVVRVWLWECNFSVMVWLLGVLWQWGWG